MKTNLVGLGTREKPWVLKTPSGSSEYQMYRDEKADPPALVCLVGKTELRYYLRCIEDLHAMLKAHGDWMLLGSVRWTPSLGQDSGLTKIESCHSYSVCYR